MGFSTNNNQQQQQLHLQQQQHQQQPSDGIGAHEALLQRQESELRLLETMRRCLVAKARCDRDYASALTTVVQQGLKSLDQQQHRLSGGADDRLAGGRVMHAWKSMLDELENACKLIRQRADHVDTKLAEALNGLHQEKRRLRKTYQEEHGRIVQQFVQLTDEVNRKKSEYQKYLELYKLMRSRFEEHYVKSGRGGRKLDEVRDKYQKACRKLHLTHNEYVLLLCEAVEFERDYRTVLVPGLLEHQQSVQEALAVTWKRILQDVYSDSDFASEQFRELRSRVEQNVEAIRPDDEYKELVEKHKFQNVEGVLLRALISIERKLEDC